MAEDKLEISKIRLPSGTVYDIKDETARDSIPTKTSQLENDSKFINYAEEGGEVSISGKEPLYKDITYNALNTEHKTIIEAINEAAESGGGGNVEDIQINEASILNEDKIANIAINSYYGLKYTENGLCIQSATQDNISTRDKGDRPIVPKILDYAVKAAMTDGKGEDWTDEEKIAAQTRIGVENKQEKLIAGDNITIDEETNTISAAGGGSNIIVAPTLTSGTKVADITVDGTTQTLYTPTVDSTTFVSKLPKGQAGTSFVNDKIFVGDFTNSVNNAFTNVRKLSNASGVINSGVITGSALNGACFSVNSDGTAAFFHKTYSDSASIRDPGAGARNNAVLRFYATRDGVNSVGKLQFAVNTGSSAVPTESMYKDVAMIDDIPIYKAGNNIIIDDDYTISASGGGEVPEDVVLWTEPLEGIIPTKNTAIYQHEEYDTLNTNNKTVFGAINELAAKHVCCTQAQYDAMSEAQKANTFFYIIEEE